MKIKTLTEALKCYLTQVSISDADRQDALSALMTCAATAERYESKATFDGGVTLLSDESLIELLIELTYDVYGKLNKLHGGDVPFDYYTYNCRKIHCLEQFTDEQLEVGYEVVGDLWADNEADGAHNDDGTFRV